MKRIIFVTESYNNDKVFFETEITKLSKEYLITLVSTNGIEHIDKLPKNVEVIFYENQVSVFKKIFYFFTFFFHRYSFCEMKEISARNGSIFSKKSILQTIKSIEFFTNAELFYRYISKQLGIMNEDGIYYSFWCNYYAMSPLLHKRHFKGWKYITRLHGFDLYDERYSCGRQPFKSYINTEIDKLIFISSRSVEYYKEQYVNVDNSKIEICRLGTKEIIQETNLVSECFTIVSCSNVIKLKRIDYIIKALAELDERIHWIHFGDGSMLEEVEQEAKERLEVKRNITYEFRGRVSNEEIRTYYEENKVDLFINVSESEGAPVSIMEAMSVGIPIIATNVGEIPIMINGNGILLDANASIAEVSNAIRKVIHSSDTEKKNYKESSIKIWKEYFDIDCNVNRFMKMLQKL